MGRGGLIIILTCMIVIKNNKKKKMLIWKVVHIKLAQICINYPVREFVGVQGFATRPEVSNTVNLNLSLISDKMLVQF